MHIIMHKYREKGIAMHIYLLHTSTCIFIHLRNKDALLSCSIFLQQSNMIYISAINIFIQVTAYLFL